MNNHGLGRKLLNKVQKKRTNKCSLRTTTQLPAHSIKRCTPFEKGIEANSKAIRDKKQSVDLKRANKDHDELAALLTLALKKLARKQRRSVLKTMRLKKYKLLKKKRLARIMRLKARSNNKLYGFFAVKNKPPEQHKTISCPNRRVHLSYRIPAA